MKNFKVDHNYAIRIFTVYCCTNRQRAIMSDGRSLVAKLGDTATDKERDAIAKLISELSCGGCYEREARKTAHYNFQRAFTCATQHTQLTAQ